MAVKTKTPLSKRITVSDAQIHYWDVGEGPAVVLLHAFPLHAELFRAQWEALGHRYRFLLPDLRGLGKSTLGAEAASRMERMAKDVLAVMTDAGEASAVVGGVSMGGYVSMALLQEDPSRVRALLLLDTQMGADDEAARNKREETAQAVLQKGPVVLEEGLLPRLMAPCASEAVKAEARRLLLENKPEGLAAALRGMALRGDSRDILGRFGNPALILVGAEDTVTPPDKAKAMGAVVPKSEVVQIPSAGHLSCLEAPETVNDLLARFLDRVSA